MILFSSLLSLSLCSFPFSLFSLLANFGKGFRLGENLKVGSCSEIEGVILFSSLLLFSRLSFPSLFYLLPCLYLSYLFSLKREFRQYFLVDPWTQSPVKENRQRSHLDYFLSFGTQFALKDVGSDTEKIEFNNKQKNRNQ